TRGKLSPRAARCCPAHCRAAPRSRRKMTTERNMIVLLADFELFFEIDDAGFVALVCPGAYAGYVGEDWTLEQVTGRFVEQMNARNLFIAYPGPDSAGEPLRVSNRPSRMAARREASGLLRVGDDGLWLTDYAQLTMAAQFKDEPPAAGHHVRLS